MATATVSRGARRKQIKLEEARKAGLAPAEVDENGEEINPHVPDFMLKAPWYYTTSETPSLKHQKNWKLDPFCIDASSSYDRGAKIYQAETYRKGACEKYALLPPVFPLDFRFYCGAITHDAKACTERPRKLGAKFTSKNIAPDEKIQSLKLNYDGKRDRWNGYDSSTYHRVQELYDTKEDAHKKYLKDEKLKKLEEKHKHQEVNDPTSDWDEEDDDLRVDEAKVDGSKQMDFAKVEKRVRSTGGGSTGTVRNLRIREDKAKYLYNLDADSAHYDPKSRSMRKDPLLDADPNQKFYSGDNGYRNSGGHALEFKQLNILSWEAFDMIQDMHMQAAPSRAEFLYKKVKAGKDKLKSQTKDAIMGKYGNAATQDEIPMELLLGQSERQVEYDRAGRILKGQVWFFDALQRSSMKQGSR